MSKTRDIGFLGNIMQYTSIGNISLVSGSTTLMFVSASGNVGIGTTTPFAIAGVNLSLNNATDSAIQLGVNGTRTGQLYASSTEVRLSAVTNVPLRFYTNDTAVMAITGSNVGIGTSTPSYTLDVTGTGRFTSQLAINTTNTTYATLNLKASGTQLYNGIAIYSTDGTESFIGLGCSGTIAGVNVTYGSTGAYLPFVVITGGAERMRITSGGHLLFGTTNDLSMYSTWDNGVIRFGRGGLLFSYANDDANLMISQNYYVNTAGNDVRINTGYASNIFMSNGAIILRTTGTSSAGSTISWNSGLTISAGGYLVAPVTYANTTTNAANLEIASNGTFERSTASSRRFKENIIDWDGNGLNTILALKPVTFTYKADYYKNPDKVMLGLIAEDVAEISPYLADYENEDRTGQVENVRYANIVVPLIKAIQELKAENDTLKEILQRNNIQ
jgi:hypothetical protein